MVYHESEGWITSASIGNILHVSNLCSLKVLTVSMKSSLIFLYSRECRPNQPKLSLYSSLLSQDYLSVHTRIRKSKPYCNLQLGFSQDPDSCRKTTLLLCSNSRAMKTNAFLNTCCTWPTSLGTRTPSPCRTFLFLKSNIIQISWLAAKCITSHLYTSRCICCAGVSSLNWSKSCWNLSTFSSSFTLFPGPPVPCQSFVSSFQWSMYNVNRWAYSHIPADCWLGGGINCSYKLFLNPWQYITPGRLYFCSINLRWGLVLNMSLLECPESAWQPFLLFFKL